MKMARAYLGTQAEVAPEGTVSRAAMSRSASKGGALGRRVAVLAFFGVVVVACNVYDESLLTSGGGGNGGVVGTGGNAPGSGGSGGIVGTGGGAGDGATPSPDASQGGGGTGGTGAGGAGGSGGTVTGDSSMVSDVRRDVVDAAVSDRPDTSVPPTCPLLIDDMEMTFGQINDGCRNGFWFTYNDGTVGGAISPATGTAFVPQAQSVPRPPSTKAAHVVGSGYTSAGMGVNFNAPPSGTRSVYNASAYIGVTFWAIGVGTISVAMPDKDTDPAGGICADGGRAGCFDHFLAPVTLISNTWQQYTVLFSQLRQKGFGYAPPGGFDKNAVFGIQWGVTMGGPFDFWVDDVSFITSITDAGGQ